ncbi:MAG: phosphoribosylformylglycinamidine cyclo-ligase [Oligoflexia bacterium]|nr:phosphoribosylformylglycinamidine cyclo-ligase [Oligoflexia bacterium]
MISLCHNDLKLKERCSQLAKRYTSASSGFERKYELYANIVEIAGRKIGITSDGIGTKIEIAERAGIYDSLGFDLVAMVVDDLICNGIIPLTLSNILDVDYLNEDVVGQLMIGLAAAANQANITISGGETAELASRINGYGNKMHFNWCATAIGYLPEESPGPILGEDLESGDVIITLKEYGFRSNGFTLIRKILNNNNNDLNKYLLELLRPSIIYSPLIVKILYEKNINLKGIAHITGGSFANKLGRVLKNARRNVKGAYLSNLFAPTDLMIKIEELGFLSDDTAYSYFNMGNGMLLVTNKHDVDSILQIAKENNYEAQVAGEIINEPAIKIISKGYKPTLLNFTL